MIYVDLQCSYGGLFFFCVQTWNLGFCCFNLVTNLVTGALGVGSAQYVSVLVLGHELPRQQSSVPQLSCRYVLGVGQASCSQVALC